MTNGANQKTHWIGNLTLLLLGVIISLGFVVAALIYANAVADRPMVGSLSGSFSAAGYEYPDLMTTDSLISYIGNLSPDNYEEEIDEDGFVVASGYDAAMSKQRTEVETNITSGKWPGFPYVQLGDQLYFSKKAVDEWFYEQANQRLSVK